MGCAACCVRPLDVVAQPHKPYVHPPGHVHPNGHQEPRDPNGHQEPRSADDHVGARVRGETVSAKTGGAAESRVVAAKTSKATVADARQTTAPILEPGLAKKTHKADEAVRRPRSVEEEILEEGSEMQGLRLCPWSEDDEDVRTNFGLHQQGERKPFVDGAGLLELSGRQRDSLHAWRRMSELIREGQGEPTVLEAVPASRAICQGLVGDCSFLSALSVLAEYEQRFQEPVLGGILYPRATSSTNTGVQDAGPVCNENGKYGCKLFFNGTVRKVVVDDQVPVRSDGKLLCAHSSRSRELWVTLLEKSFVKIMGSSYDMQGSNPGTDVFHLTGWMPETIPLNSNGDTICGAGDLSQSLVHSGRTGWDDIFAEACEGYHRGRCVVCVGTSELEDAAPDAEARRLGHIEGVSVSTGLVSRHAYPVLDCRRLGGARLLRLKNPWGRVRWRGRFAPGDAAWAACGSGQQLAEALGGVDPIAEAAADDGHFWIEWKDVLRYFSHLYLCWSPEALGLHQVEIHCRWDPFPLFSQSSLPDDTHVTAFNPQFLVRLSAPPPEEKNGGATIWALLSRHVRMRADISSKYVAAHVYRGSSRLCCPDAPLEQGVYSNGECALVKLHAEKINGERDFVITVSQHGQKSVFNFTMQVYTTVPATVTALPPLVPKSWVSGSADGCWHKGTSGGCSNNLWSFFSNPQWRFEVPEGGVDNLFMFLECSLEHSVNIRLFSGAVARPESLRHAKSSGAYRQGCCFMRVASLAPGPYVAVVSTFRAGLIGSYRLAWHAPRSLIVKPQPHPFALALDPPLAISARKVARGCAACFRLATEEEGRALLSFRVQTHLKDGVFQPKLSLHRLLSGDAGGEPQVAPGVELLKESFAESYMAYSGCAAVLLAPLDPGVAYELQVFVPKGGRADEADLFITSDGKLDIRSHKPRSVQPDVN